MSGSSWHKACFCGPFKPKWMKIVDNIYKSTPNDISYHSKLLQFCVRKPDKLDRIAAYLLRNLSYHISHNNDGNVNLTMEAVNSLMNACHQRLNLFIVNCLKMIQLLLESNKAEYQLLGCKSFMQFSQLSEDTPSYHKEYEYLIQHFSALAHSNNQKESDKIKLRIAGIKGITGVTRKCTMDQLQVNVLDLRCLNNIIPALLFNMEIPTKEEPADSIEETPSMEAILAFKEIVLRASFNIQPVISAIFTYLDDHKLWYPAEFMLFVIDTFLISIKSTQPAYTLMKQLVSHLTKEQSPLNSMERTAIVHAINKTVISLAAQAVGPDIFQNFKSLLQILRQSIESTSAGTNQDRISINSQTQEQIDKTPSKSKSNTTNPEKMFQEAIITTIAEFAKNLPDTQKIEIMKFILNFDSMCFDKAYRSRQLVHVLLKTMLQVATQYRTGSIALIFNSDFLNLLLNGVAIDRDPSNRIFVQKILHTLIDRHDNTQKLSQIKIIDKTELFNSFKIDKPSRQDLIFMKKTGTAIIENLFIQIIDPTNKVDNLEHIYCTLCLISLEMGAEHVIVDLYRLICGVQSYVHESLGASSSAVQSSTAVAPAATGTISIATPVTAAAGPTQHIPVTHICAIHALLAAFIQMLSLIADINPLQKHVSEIIALRRSKAPYLLPDVAFNRSNTANAYPCKMAVDDQIYFNCKFIKDKLTSSNYDVSLFDVPYKSKPGTPTTLSTSYPRKMSIFYYMAQGEMNDAKFLSGSMTSLSVSESGSTIHEEDESKMRNLIEEDHLSFEAIKKLLDETPDERNKRKTAKELEMTKYFREVGFEKICRDHREKYLPLKQNLLDIVQSTTVVNHEANSSPIFEKHNNYRKYMEHSAPNVHQIQYPELFVNI